MPLFVSLPQAPSGMGRHATDLSPSQLRLEESPSVRGFSPSPGDALEAPRPTPWPIPALPATYSAFQLRGFGRLPGLAPATVPLLLLGHKLQPSLPADFSVGLGKMVLGPGDESCQETQESRKEAK